MVSFVALPALLILLTLVSVGLRVIPVSKTAPAADGVRASAPVPGFTGTQGQHGPCEPRAQVLEAARRAAGPDYYGEAAPQMAVVGNRCQVLLWRLPQKPGGFLIVELDAS